MKIKDSLLEMTNDALRQGKSLVDIATTVIKVGPSKTAVKKFVSESGILPALRPLEYGTQAGMLIYKTLGENANDSLKKIMEYDANSLPAVMSKMPFYALVCFSPSAFLSCLIIYEESPANKQRNNATLLHVSGFDSVKAVSKLDTTPNAADAAVSAALLSFGIPIPPQAIHGYFAILGNIKDYVASKFGPGEQGQDLIGGYIEPYHYFAGGDRIGQIPTPQKYSLGYWRGNSYPDTYAVFKSLGLNPPPPPSQSDKEGIAKALLFDRAKEQMMIDNYKLMSTLPNNLEGWRTLINTSKANLNLSAEQLAAAATTAQKKESVNTQVSDFSFPEIGSVSLNGQTFSWGLTNNKAVIIYSAIGGLVILAIAYFLIKGRNK